MQIVINAIGNRSQRVELLKATPKSVSQTYALKWMQVCLQHDTSYTKLCIEIDTKHEMPSVVLCMLDNHDD